MTVIKFYLLCIRVQTLRRHLLLAFMMMGCLPFIHGCFESPSTDSWGPVVELRDDTQSWPDGKPAGGWWVTPIHATLLPSGNILITGWGRRDRTECAQGGTRKHGTSFLLDPDMLGLIPGKRASQTLLAE